jgi:hypothetical protein
MNGISKLFFLMFVITPSTSWSSSCKAGFKIKNAFTLPAGKTVFHFQNGNLLPFDQAPKDEVGPLCKVELEQESAQDIFFKKGTTLVPVDTNDCMVNNFNGVKGFIGKMKVVGIQHSKNKAIANVICTSDPKSVADFSMDDVLNAFGDEIKESSTHKKRKPAQSN